MAEAQLQLHAADSDFDTPLVEKAQPIRSNWSIGSEEGELRDDDDQYDDTEDVGNDDNHIEEVEFYTGMRCPIAICSRKNWKFSNYGNYSRHFASFHEEKVLYISCELCTYKTKRFHDFKSHLRNSHKEIKEYEIEPLASKKYYSRSLQQNEEYISPGNIKVVPRISEQRYNRNNNEEEETKEQTKEHGNHLSSGVEEMEKQNENEDKRSKVNKANITVISERGSSKRKLVFENERRFKIMKEMGDENEVLGCEEIEIDNERTKKETIPDDREGLINMILRLKALSKETTKKLEEAKTKLKAIERQELEDLKREKDKTEKLNEQMAKEIRKLKEKQSESMQDEKKLKKLRNQLEETKSENDRMREAIRILTVKK